MFSFFYVGIRRDLYWRLAIISGEVRRSIIVGIQAVTLDRLHTELIIEPRPPGRDVVWAQCVTWPWWGSFLRVAPSRVLIPTHETFWPAQLFVYLSICAEGGEQSSESTKMHEKTSETPSQINCSIRFFCVFAYLFAT